MYRRLAYALTVASSFAVAGCDKRENEPIDQSSASDEAYQTALRCYHAYAFATSYVQSKGDPNNSASIFKAKQDEGFKQLVSAGALVGKSTADVLAESLDLIEQEKFGDPEVIKRRLEEAGECNANAIGPSG